MKTKFRYLFIAPALLALASLNSQLSTAFGQGALTPPGAPAPTMKSLDQIEARTAITNTSTTAGIIQPGSYYLTHNLTVNTGNGIDILTNGVTLDLNGFTISSTAASATGTGILLGSGLQNITIVNGFIQGGVTNNGSGVYGGGGFANGIYFSGGEPVNALVSRVSVLGCRNFGILLGNGNSTVAESCTVKTIGSGGINASTVKSCSAMDCGSDAIIGDEVSDCRGQSSRGDGIDATTALNCYGESDGGGGIYSLTAQNCYGESDGSGPGIEADEINNCEGYSDSGYGIYAGNIAIGSTGTSSTGTGILAFIANSCYGYNDNGISESITYKYNMP